MSARRGVFRVMVVVTLGLAGLFASMVALMNLQPGFMGMAHFTTESHRIHDVTFSLLNGTVVIGMLVQLRAPVRNVLGQVMALVPFGTLLLATALTNAWVLSPPWLALGVTTVFATMFHPAGDPLRWFRGARLERGMTMLVAAAAVPLLAFAWTNLGLQRAGPTDHAVQGHYGFMMAFSFTVIALGLIAASRAGGWRIAGWAAGALPIALGVVSVMYPAADSRLEPAWVAATIAWGAMFIVAAERAGRAPVAPETATG